MLSQNKKRITGDVFPQNAAHVFIPVFRDEAGHRTGRKLTQRFGLRVLVQRVLPQITLDHTRFSRVPAYRQQRPGVLFLRETFQKLILFRQLPGILRFIGQKKAFQTGVNLLHDSPLQAWSAHISPGFPEPRESEVISEARRG